MIKDKELKDLHNLIEGKDFKSKEEMVSFMENMIGKKIPSALRKARSKQDEAQDLVYEAQGLSDQEGRVKALQALEIDPDCIDAYEYLGMIEKDPTNALEFFSEGVKAGNRVFDENFVKENKGNYWGLLETRPFMRCLFHTAEYLYYFDEIEKSIQIKELMIELNPNDNQGVRDDLLLHLLEIGDFEKFDFYHNMYPDDIGAFPLFNHALCIYKREGDTANSNSLLQKALEFNKHVSALLISKKTFPLPDMYGFGDEAEAKIYTARARDIWLKTNGAIFWLKRNLK
jgi:tetratricopeptide (TPR) repeat protein